ncbi:NADPH-dependent glutamate synthase [Vallitalea guaymasensis]|uniref:NADPH-dependent glutamate synthase n=1 Tax=Vallitalea guaymasensis TaxID=1185412 RepID=UPI0023546476|nr:NADPH-dependent glutamate synthase [Vallitalea guaymasensis]
MPNMSKEKVKMKEQDPLLRIKNFDEVTCGYTLEEAMEEAGRCLQCKTRPCVGGCPVSVPIPEFIKEVSEGNIEEAYNIIATENRLPAICGRVCPQESQCEGKCVRGRKGEPVAIGRLERFVADYYMENIKKDVEKPESNNKKVAVVGGGPASLTCAADLAKKGYEVTMYEALHQLGGVLMYGIPEFRLPKGLVQTELKSVTDLGVKVEKNVIVGKSITIDELFEEEGFQAVFVGSGAGLPRFMNIDGENLNGVYSANEFLTRVNLMKAYDFPNSPTPVRIGEKVAVIGGGNVAMDAARTAKRLGAKEVKIVYRRSKEELPARVEEVHHAEEEQIIFDLLKNPVEIIGEDGHVTGMKCIKMELGEPDESGRRRPQPIEGSEEVMDVDIVVVAIGQTPNPLLRDTTDGLDVNKRGCIVVNEDTMETTLENVYAGGDAVTGAATVILAMGAGKKAAKAIDEKLSK